MIFLAFPYRRPLPKGQWAVAYVCATNYHKLILMQATAKMAMGSGFRRDSVSELKLKNRCTGSTFLSYSSNICRSVYPVWILIKLLTDKVIISYTQKNFNVM